MQRYDEKSVTRIDRLRTKLPEMRFLALHASFLHPCGSKRPAVGRLLLALAIEELPRGLPRGILEHPREVLRIFKAQLFGHPVDALATEDEVLGAHHHEAAYVVLRAFAKGLANDVAKIARREAQLAGAVLYAWQSVLLLQAMRIIVGHHLLETAQDIAAFSRHFLVLAEVEAVAVVEDELYIVPDDVVMPEGLRLCCQLPAQVRHELAQYVLLFRSQNQCFVRQIGEELVAVELLLYGCALYELRSKASTQP